MGRLRGYLTVYLALAMTVILSLVLVLIMGVRRNTVRCEAEIAYDNSMQSVLAEYHREMWKKYDLLYIDTSYGSDEPDRGKTAAHIQDYMNENLVETGFMSCRLRDVSISEASVPTDEDGRVFRQQVITAMREMYGIEEVEALAENFAVMKDYGLDTADYTEEQKENQEAINTAEVYEEYTYETEVEDDLSDDPAALVAANENGRRPTHTETRTDRRRVEVEDVAGPANSLRSMGLLPLVTDTSKVSMKVLPNEDYISWRLDVIEGNGMNPDIETDQLVISDLVDELLYQKYVLTKFGCFTGVKKKTQMDYEVEYILFGKESDTDNLKAAVNRIMLLREAANVLFLTTDRVKNAAVTALAATVAAVTLSPELEPVIKWSVIFGWAYIETIQDLKVLLAGGKIPLIKTAESWQTDISMVANAALNLPVNQESTGMSYQDYLMLLMLLEDEHDKLFRTMDVMEMDIRKTEGNEYFRIDGCIDSLLTEVTVESADGYACTIKRRWGYP